MYVLTKITPLRDISRKDYKALNLAIYQAEKSLYSSSRRLGACLIVQGKCIYGENQHRQKMGKTFTKSVHAEMNTLFKFLKNKKHYDMKKNSLTASGVIYVVRLMNMKDGKCDFFKYLLGNSKPCKRCQSFLYRHMVKKIKFTNIIDGVNVLCEMRRCKL